MGAEVAVALHFTQQQLQRLAEIQLRPQPDINGSHDRELTISNEEKRSPYAFDLGRAWEVAQKLGDGYHASFIADTRYYLKECYGKVPTTDYYHEIRRGMQDDITLYLGYGEKARDSYATPAKDESLPTWYRERASMDGGAIEDLESALSHATGDDIFLDISPAQFDMFDNLDELKKWHFGVHSFVRVHRLVKENGCERLASRGIRVYLGPAELRTLYQEATGEEAPNELLGNSKKIVSHHSLGWIQQRAQELYDQTPEDKKIKPLDDDGVFKDDEEMNIILDLPFFANWQERIFTHMLQKPSSEDDAEAIQDAIEKEFHGLEMALRDFLSGTLSLAEIQAPSRDYRVGAVDVRSMPHGLMAHYAQNVEYKAPGACDGNGSGRKRKKGLGSSTMSTSSELMTYDNMTLNEVIEEESTCSCGSNEDNHYHCPDCDRRFADETNVPEGQRTKACSCGCPFGC